jgi:class 3 adenylate cyclase
LSSTSRSAPQRVSSIRGIDEFEQLGLYDPAAPDADERRALLDYLVDLGATPADLSEYRDELPVAASMLAVRPRGLRITLRELARRIDVDDNEMERLWIAAGLPVAEPDDPVAFDQTADLFAPFRIASEIFGPDASVQLLRTVGEMLARLADALVSTVVVALGVPAARDDDSMLALARANAQAASLLDPFMVSLETLLRHHLELARRPFAGDFAEGQPGYEARDLAIGFADLTGSTDLAARVEFGDLARALSDFESAANDAVHREGGRVVKMIGDEVMFSAPSINAAGAIGCRLIDAISSHPVLPPVRVGIAAGRVLVRHGDCFGPVVNLAARLVAHAEPGTVVAPASIADDVSAGDAYATEALGDVHLRGFEAPIPVVAIQVRR